MRTLDTCRVNHTFEEKKVCKPGSHLSVCSHCTPSPKGKKVCKIKKISLQTWLSSFCLLTLSPICFVFRQRGPQFIGQLFCKIFLQLTFHLDIFNPLKNFSFTFTNPVVVYSSCHRSFLLPFRINLFWIIDLPTSLSTFLGTS